MTPVRCKTTISTSSATTTTTSAYAHRGLFVAGSMTGLASVAHVGMPGQVRHDYSSSSATIGGSQPQ